MKLHRFLLTLLACLAVFASVSAAQELDAEPELNDLALLSQVINWGGIFSAIVIILIALLLLRFVDRHSF